MKSNKFGDLKETFFVWLFVVLYFAILILFNISLEGSLPQNLTILVVLNLLLNMAMTYGVILVFIVLFLAFWEKRHSLREIFSCVGLKRNGSIKSVLWSFALTPFFLVIFLFMTIISSLLGSIPTPVSNNGQVPQWFLYYMIITSFFPVAVVEEIFARGFILDRLIPQHPSNLAKALPAILLSSLLFSLYHLPTYLVHYFFSPLWVFVLLAGNVFPISIILSIAYVQAKSRNIIGPVLIHFLADSIPIILMLI